MASEDLFSRLVGGVLLAAGLLVALLGDLCTGWIMVPETVRLWNAHRLAELGYDWAVVPVGGSR